jgi:hypothetical protein
MSLLLIAGTALAIDLGRLALPEKNPDSMDIILQWVGGVLGYVIIRVILSRKLLAVKSGRAASSSNENRQARPVKRVMRRSEGEA